MKQELFGQRLRALRASAGLSQEDLARLLNVNDRQTISNIENGDRKMTADELILVVERLGVPLDYFTNPFSIVGEARFSWRQMNVAEDELAAFESKAGEWIGAYRELSQRMGDKIPFVLPRLGLTSDSSYAAATMAGEKIAVELELGDIPSKNLSTKIEEKLNILMLMVDATHGISGAACQLPELNAVIVNRSEPLGRRNFDLAHELFHILTWDAMPPEHRDGSGTSRIQRKIEVLAENFASGLLMPTYALEMLGEVDGDPAEWLNAKADILGVSSMALKWRMVNSRRYPTAKEIDDDLLRRNGRTRGEQELPPQFGHKFCNVLRLALDNGHISVRKAAKLLDIPVDELANVFVLNDVAAPATL